MTVNNNMSGQSVPRFTAFRTQEDDSVATRWMRTAEQFDVDNDGLFGDEEFQAMMTGDKGVFANFSEGFRQALDEQMVDLMDSIRFTNLDDKGNADPGITVDEAANTLAMLSVEKGSDYSHRWGIFWTYSNSDDTIDEAGATHVLRDLLEGDRGTTIAKVSEHFQAVKSDLIPDIQAISMKAKAGSTGNAPLDFALKSDTQRDISYREFRNVAHQLALPRTRWQELYAFLANMDGQEVKTVKATAPGADEAAILTIGGMSPAELTTMFEVIDDDGNGTLSKSEIEAAGNNPDKVMKNAARQYDKTVVKLMESDHQNFIGEPDPFQKSPEISGDAVEDSSESANKILSIIQNKVERSQNQKIDTSEEISHFTRQFHLGLQPEKLIETSELIEFMVKLEKASGPVNQEKLDRIFSHYEAATLGVMIDDTGNHNGLITRDETDAFVEKWEKLTANNRRELSEKAYAQVINAVGSQSA
ncbi:MAG: hypothetical protein KTR14_03535 [Vampirovibrio sp.]|nr:hypothetical protein [Vampirovibrio sp.]